MVAQAQGGCDKKEALEQGGLEVPPTAPCQRCPSATLMQALALSGQDGMHGHHPIQWQTALATAL